jgi:hypothetical protein
MRETTISFVIHEIGIAVQINLDFGRISVVFYWHMKSNGVERKVEKDHERSVYLESALGSNSR